MTTYESPAAQDVAPAKAGAHVSAPKDGWMSADLAVTFSTSATL
jgi:hypothetical protein